MSSTFNQRLILYNSLELGPPNQNKNLKSSNNIQLYAIDGKLQVKDYNNKVSEVPISVNVTINTASYQCNALDNYVFVDSTGLTTISITLPISTSVANGKTLTVVDYSKTSSSKPIVITSDVTIQNDTSVLMDVDGMTLTFLFNNNSWSII